MKKTRKPPLMIGGVAQRFGLPVRSIRRLFERGLLPEPGRVGPHRIFFEDDLPRIERALLAAGYLRTEQLAGASK